MIIGRFKGLLNKQIMKKCSTMLFAYKYLNLFLYIEYIYIENVFIYLSECKQSIQSEQK